MADTLPHLRLRPSRLTQSLPRVRNGDHDKGDSMKRVLRWLLNGLTVLSLLLCVATVVLWVRSYSVCTCLACQAGMSSGR